MTGPTRRALLAGAGALCLCRCSARAGRDTDQADLGTLTPFYRAMQMQAHIPGHGLMRVPDYLTAPTSDLRYHPRPGATEEIPFVDSFTITRFLGGMREQWLQQLDEDDPALGRASLDYVVTGAGGLRARPDIIQRHLDPYLHAGYALSDITIVLDNTPWGIARGGGAEGPFGQKNPPASIDDWRQTITDLAYDLHRLYPGQTPNFKVGNEYDTKKSFDGTAQDYLNLYLAAHNVLRRAFPTAQIASAEFTRGGTCAAAEQGCVFDTADFLSNARVAGAAPDYVPRSLNTFQNQTMTMPSDTVSRAEISYARLGGVIPEIHQFGLLGQPFGDYGQVGSDQGSRRAAWEFATLTGLQRRLKPRRVFHWSTLYAPRNMDVALMNGIGFAHTVLDRYVGARMTSLPATADDQGAEITAVRFDHLSRQALVISCFSPKGGNTVQVSMPFAAATANWKFTRTGTNTGPFSAIRRDLAADNNLKPEFAATTDCTSDPDKMATDRARLRAMLSDHRAEYEAAGAAELKLRPLAALPYRITQSGGRLSFAMPANELLVLEAE